MPATALAHRGPVEVATRTRGRPSILNPIPLEQMTKEDRIAMLLLRSIIANLGGTDYFTREDLIHLPVFSHIATISRYRQICYSVHNLLRMGEITQINFTRLALPGRKKNKAKGDPDPKSIVDQYRTTVHRTVETMPKGSPFVVMDLVGAWKTDPQLTLNAKREVVRACLRRLVHDGDVKSVADFGYETA